MLHMAGNIVVRYIGSETKKLWEVGGRNCPVVNEGDLIIMDQVTATVLCRNRFFEKVEDAIVDVSLPAKASQEENQGEENQGEENPPADLEESNESVQEEVVSEEEVHEVAESVDSEETVAEAAPKKKGK